MAEGLTQAGIQRLTEPLRGKKCITLVSGLQVYPEIERVYIDTEARPLYLVSTTGECFPWANILIITPREH